MRWEPTRCILFQTELRVWSGPGADDGEERANALPTSSAGRARQSLNGSPGRIAREEMFEESPVQLQRCRGTRELRETGGGRPTANFFAVQTVCGVAEARKADQWSLFAFFMALK